MFIHWSATAWLGPSVRVSRIPRTKWNIFAIKVVHLTI